MTNRHLEPHEPKALQPLSVVDMLRGVDLERLDPGKIDKLLDVQMRVIARQAEQEFNRAFVQLQARLRPITATRVIRGKDGSVRSRYASYEEIMEHLRPLLLEAGFAVTRDHEAWDKQVTCSMTLLHAGGHSRTNSFTVRTAGGPPGTSSEQADGSAASYAARYALRDALNLVYIEPDQDDARKVGSPISEEQAASLRSRVRAAGIDELKFLQYAQVEVDGAPSAEHYNAILSGLYPRLDRLVSERER